MKTRLIFKNLIKNKKKTFVAVANIVLATVLIVSMINVYLTYKDMIIKNAYHNYGKYHIMLNGTNEETIELIEANYSEYMAGYEKTYIAGADEGLLVVSCDDNAIAMNNYTLLKGNFPKEDNHIALSATTIIDGDYVYRTKKLGDTITITEEGVSYEFELSGILEYYNYGTETTQLAIIGDNQRLCYEENIYLYCTSEEDVDNIVKDIKKLNNYSKKQIVYADKETGIDMDVPVIINNDLVEIELKGKGSIDNINTENVLKILFGIIALTSVVFVMNAFFSRFGERRQQQAVLINCGYSRWCIFYMYLIEGVIIGVVGICLGVFLGILTTKGIVDFVQAMRINPLKNFEITVSVSKVFLSVVLCFVAVLIGIIVPIVVCARKTIKQLLMHNDSIKEKRHTTQENRRQSERFIATKMFLRDSLNQVREEIFVYMSLILIGFIFIAFMCLQRYTEDYITKFQSEYTFSEFVLILGDDDNKVDAIEEQLSDCQFFNVMYNGGINLYVEQSDINQKLAQYLQYSDEKDYILVNVCGVTKEWYESELDVEGGVTYDNLVACHGAIIVDNYQNGTNTFLTADNAVYKYTDDYEEREIKEGEVNIVARARKTNESSYIGNIMIVVPVEHYKDNFYTSLTQIDIIANKGHENAMGDWLDKHQNVYGYSLNDYVTKYVKAQDNTTMLRMGAIIVLVVVTAINSFNIYYMNKSKILKRKRYIGILKVMGYGNRDIACPMIAENIIKGAIGAIVSTFIVVILLKGYIPNDIGYVVTEGRVYYLIANLIWMIIIELVSTLVIFRLILKQNFLSC